jgi:hypothetical protein
MCGNRAPVTAICWKRCLEGAITRLH